MFRFGTERGLRGIKTCTFFNYCGRVICVIDVTLDNPAFIL